MSCPLALLFYTHTSAKPYVRLGQATVNCFWSGHHSCLSWTWFARCVKSTGGEFYTITLRRAWGRTGRFWCLPYAEFRNNLSSERERLFQLAVKYVCLWFYNRRFSYRDIPCFKKCIHRWAGVFHQKHKLGAPMEKRLNVVHVLPFNKVRTL